MIHKPPLTPGYHALPEGYLANVVTCLEMKERPVLRPTPEVAGLALERLGAQDTARFRDLFRAVGEDLMWFSRLLLAEEALSGIIGHPQVQCLALVQEGKDIGLLELDFREEKTCELSFFGVVPSAVGGGAGRFLMNEALTRAWAQPISRLWVHTCSFDHPKAIAFYQRSGFKPYQIMVEVHPDPRLTGHMAEHGSPQVPLLRKAR